LERLSIYKPTRVSFFHIQGHSGIDLSVIVDSLASRGIYYLFLLDHLFAQVGTLWFCDAWVAHGIGEQCSCYAWRVHQRMENCEGHLVYCTVHMGCKARDRH
jgi:hypothetical protein